MPIGKRVMMIIAVIAILILLILGTKYLDLPNIKESMESAAINKAIKMANRGEGPLVNSEVIEREDQALPGMEIDNIFFAPDFDYVAMYGDPRDWDDEKNMCIDKNGDDRNDINFTIAPNIYDGIDLEGSVKQSNGSWKSMNFWSSDLYKLFRNSLQEKAQLRTVKAKDFFTLDISSLLLLLQEGKYIVKGYCIVDDDYVQISICDIDEDGLDEVLASVGNQRDENVTAIYEFSDVGKTPFTYCGYICCDTVIEYKGNNLFWAYRESLKDKQHDTYIYNGIRVKKLAGVNDYED